MLYIVGFGPGSYEQMTVEADRALQESDLIIGYTTYVDIIRPWFPGKEFLVTPMKQEKERCRIAIEEEKKGKKVSLVCSGDSGIYGMASLVYELAEQEEGFAERIHVIAGVTAAASGGALLGAPLSHDFLTVSLSDLLTPMEVIQNRIRSGAESDTVLCIYNPSSRKRGGLSADGLRYRPGEAFRTDGLRLCAEYRQRRGKSGGNHVGRTAGYTGGYVYYRIYRKQPYQEYPR